MNNKQPRWWHTIGLVPLFVLAHFVHHLVTALPTPMLPFIRSEFGLDYTQSGLVISAFSLSYGIGQLPAGWLADRVGKRWLLTAGICGVAVAGILIGLSHTFLMLIVFLALMGLVGGGYHPSAAPLISSTVEPNKRGRSLGFHMIGGSASFFLSPLIAAAIAAVWGWRGSFIGLAVPTLLFGALFYVLLGHRGDNRPVGETTVSPSVPTPTQATGRVRRLAAILVLGTFTQAVLVSIISFIPLYMVDHFGINEGIAAIFVSVVYSAGIWASPLGGYLSDRIGRLPVILTGCIIVGPAIYLLNVVPYGLGIGALLLLIGAVMYIRLPVTEAYLFGQTPERHRSTIFGIYYFSNMEAGGLVIPLVGYLIDRFDFYTTLTIAGLSILAVTLACSAFLWRQRE